MRVEQRLRRGKNAFAVLTDEGHPVAWFEKEPTQAEIDDVQASYAWFASLNGIKPAYDSADSETEIAPVVEEYRFDELFEDFVFDAETLATASYTPEGWLQCQGLCARSGTQSYASGVDYRPPEEVFKDESLASFNLKPITIGHPKKLLDASTAKHEAVGSIGNPQKVVSPSGQDFVKCDLLITDAKAIDDIQRGLLGLSCGYTAKIVPFKGTTAQGERFDAVQRDIKINHLALVKLGRAGADAKLILDEKEEIPVPVPGTGREIMSENKEIPVPVLAQKQTHPLSEHSTKQKTDELQGQIVALESKIKALEEQLHAKNDAAEQELLTRFSLAVSAAPILGKEVKDLLPFSRIVLQKQVIEKIDPSIKLDDVSEDFVQGVYAVISKGTPNTVKALGKAVEQASKNAVTKLDANDAYRDMVERNKNAWKQRYGETSHAQQIVPTIIKEGN